MLIAFAIAALIATVVTGMLVPAMGVEARNWVRRIFLVVVNLHPMNWGTWRSEFTKREVAFACWFVVFLVVFVVGSLLGPCALSC
jgi:hypothetical protein